MVRRRSTVRFRNGALERKHEKRHPGRLRAAEVAFSFLRPSTVLAGPLRLSVPNTCPSFQRCPSPSFGLIAFGRVVVARSLSASLVDPVLGLSMRLAA